MNFQVYRNLQDLEPLAKSWNQLVKESASHVPFLRHEYLTSWWQTLGGGEWESGDLFVVIAYAENGDLKGIAPLFFTKNLDGKPALMLAAIVPGCGSNLTGRRNPSKLPEWGNHPKNCIGQSLPRRALPGQ